MNSLQLKSLTEASQFVMNGGSQAKQISNPEPIKYEGITESDINSLMEKCITKVFILNEVETKETREGTKYKVRVKDRQTGSSYIRFATREKIAELRANPNISSVELTDATPTNATDRGVSANRQMFNQSPNQNNASAKSVEQKRYEKEREMNKRTFGGI